MATKAQKVWDPLVRVFHWSLVAAFFIAYFTEPEDSGFAVHVWAGYFVGGLIALRVVWGFVGSKHARFSDFAFGPFRALAYLGDLARGRSKRHLGHSPAGAWMVYLLLLTLAATVLSGMTLLAMEEHQGPLAPFFGSTTTPTTSMANQPGDQGAGRAEATRDGESEPRGEEAVEEAHEIFANIVLILVILHILGVVVASAAHRENLVRAMVTGNKRSDAI